MAWVLDGSSELGRDNSDLTTVAGVPGVSKTVNHFRVVELSFESFGLALLVLLDARELTRSLIEGISALVVFILDLLGTTDDGS